MIVETGRICRLEPDAVWVETIQRTTCDSCNARHGCGQRVLSRLAGGTTEIRVLLPADSAQQFFVGQAVEIGIPEDVVVGGSLLVYLVPLAGLLTGGVLARG